MAKQTPVSISRNHTERYQFLGKIGTVISFSTVNVGPEGLHSQVPYTVAVVEFTKKRATLSLTGIDSVDVRSGMKVLGVLRRMRVPDSEDIIPYGVKCVPVGRQEL